tara:strand:+ start:643 stop:1881 length:1239 start_codon:yes stop_codon:yes gene_type:complete
MKSKFKYLPSFSVGAFGDGLRRNVMLKSKSGKEDLPIRFYSQAFPEKFRHTDFLVSAGHLLKHDPECWNTMGFDENNFVMGDSGGYQICSGAMKWKDEMKTRVFDWLQKNATVGMNLDIPPRLKLDGKFYECLDLSIKNFKYFADNQDGQTDYMNVIQGKNEYEFKTWYDKVKQYPFQGWAIGGSGYSYYKFLSGLMILLEGKEHLNPNTKYIHILGSSRVSYFLMLLQLQKSFEDMGLDIVVTTDSSSPDRAVVFGTYYTGYSLKRGTWESIGFPNEKNHEEMVDDFMSLDNPKFPYVTEFDKMLSDYVDFTNIKQEVGTEGTYTYGMRLHNFEFFKDVIDRVETLVYGHNYLLEQSISKDIYKLMTFVDEMVKSDNPRLVFEKYKDLISRMSNTNLTDNINPDAKKFFGV